MKYPEFFASVPGIRLRDPLAGFLGAFEDELIDYAYLDAVKLAGHSCPTVAGAYWLTHQALANLYGEDLPERGAIRVQFNEDRQAGVTGVIAAVVSLLTGAATDMGFAGIAGRFGRRHLLQFNAEVPLEIRFTRTDTGAQVDARANLGRVPGDPAMPALLQRCLNGPASAAERRQFAALWQDRVRRILLEHGEDDSVFEIRQVAKPAAN